MAFLQRIQHPTPRQLRQFAVTSGGLLPLLAWLWGAEWSAIAVLAGTGAAWAALGCAYPRIAQPPFVLLSWVTAPLGAIVGEAALLAIYFGVLLPIAIWSRRARGDVLGLRFEPRDSYWLRRKPPADAKHYFRQS